MQNSQLAARETAKDDVRKEVVPKKQTKELEKADFTNIQLPAMLKHRGL